MRVGGAAAVEGAIASLGVAGPDMAPPFCSSLPAEPRKSNRGCKLFSRSCALCGVEVSSACEFGSMALLLRFGATGSGGSFRFLGSLSAFGSFGGFGGFGGFSFFTRGFAPGSNSGLKSSISRLRLLPLRGLEFCQCARSAYGRMVLCGQFEYGTALRLTRELLHRMLDA